MLIETTAAQSSQPRRRSRIKHRAILGAAARLVAENGYGAVTMEQIAARAGVGKQTLYRWWPSKAALYLEVYLDLVPDDELAVEAGPVADRLAAFLARVFELYRRTPAARILCGLIGEAQSDPATLGVLRDGLVAGRGVHVVDALERAQAKGELGSGFDARWANDMIVAMIWHRLLSGGPAPDAAFARDLVRTVLFAAVAPREA